MSTGPTSHQVAIDGGRIYYQVRGSGPLLLVIGNPMTSGPFAPLADELAHDHTVVTYDPHGLGESVIDDRSAPITPEVEADDLAAIVDAVDRGPAAVLGSSGGAVAALALAARYPDRVTAVVAHEPPVTDLLPDAANVRAVVDGIEDAYLSAGAGAAWGAFVSMVMYQGEVPSDGVPPATWPPPGAAEPDAGTPDPADQASPEPPSAKQQADDELFFLRMLKPFTRYQPEVDALRDGPVRVVVAVGAASGPEIARRSAEALAERLGQPTVAFPGGHAGFIEDPPGFAATLREVLG